MDRYNNSRMGKRNLVSIDHWEQLEFGKFNITKPTIICLGGNGTINERKANNFCKLAERLIGLKLESDEIYSSYDYVDMIGLSYGTDKEEETAGDFSKEEVSTLVDNMLLPLCLDDNGEILPLEKASKNFSQLTFFTHCHGARALANIMNHLNSKLIIAGFSQEEVDAILGQTFQLAYSPYTEETLVPTVRIDSLTDSYNMQLGRAFKDAYGHFLNGIEIKHDPAGYLRNKKQFYKPHHDIISVYSSRLLNFQEPTLDPNADRLDPKNKIQVVDEHNIYDVFIRDEKTWQDKTGAKNADAVSQIAGYSLAMSIANSMANANSDILIPKMPLIELKDHLEGIKSSYSDSELARQK